MMHVSESQNTVSNLVRVIGYARVSTEEQKLGLQQDALHKHGCEKLYADLGVSGSLRLRPGLEECLGELHSGDVLVVWRLDRLGRSLQHLLEIVTDLHARDVGLVSLTENIDTTSASGRLIFSVFGALAEYERALIIEDGDGANPFVVPRGWNPWNRFRGTSGTATVTIRSSGLLPPARRKFDLQRVVSCAEEGVSLGVQPLQRPPLSGSRGPLVEVPDLRRRALQY